MTFNGFFYDEKRWILKNLKVIGEAVKNIPNNKGKVLRH